MNVPPPLPAPPFFPPEAQLATLSNGMGVVVAERHSSQVFAADLMLRGGTAASPDRPAIASKVMAESLMTGTANHSQGEIYTLMDQKLFDLDVRLNPFWIDVSARALPSAFDATIEMIADLALRPTFPGPEIEVIRRREIGQAAHAGDDPSLIGRRNLSLAIYGPQHPSARFLEPAAPALANLTRDDIARLWRETITPAETVLVIAGNVDPRAVVARAQALFEGWRADPTFRPPPAIPPPRAVAVRLIVVDRPRAPQATVFYAVPVPPVDRSTYYPSLVIAQLLGMRSGALQTALRDRLGATWSGTASLDDNPSGGMLWWQGSVAGERTADALRELDSRVRALSAPGPTQDELAISKEGLVAALPRGLESVRSLSRVFTWMVGARLPLDYLDTRRDNINGVSLDAVRAAVPDPTKTKAVVVGDLAALKPQLLALGWGTIEEHDAAGRFVRVVSP